jgi:hypothetical protein
MRMGDDRVLAVLRGGVVDGAARGVAPALPAQ